ncbi:MAG: hypothetical protein AVDCRST_MAG74-3922, partial [uncultured Pyrinomonadaceae bacterium]
WNPAARTRGKKAGFFGNPAFLIYNILFFKRNAYLSQTNMRRAN